MSCENKHFCRFVSTALFIGRGSFGDVFGPCDWNGKKCAIKTRWIKKDDTEKQLSACRKMMSLQHRRLIKVYDVSLEPNALYILMEYAGGGTLRTVLSSRQSDFPLEILMDWSTQIAEGMAYLHEKNIVHRDLKSLNIVIMEADASSNPCNKTLKITDFDQIREYDGTQTMSRAGTYKWMAPEVLTEQKFSKASDVWSYGVVLWEILTRNVPYEGVPETKLLSEATKGRLKLEIPDTCPDIIKSILKRCLSSEKSKRPSFDEILMKLQPRQDQKTNDLQEMATKQLKSFGRQIKNRFSFKKMTIIYQKKKMASLKTVRKVTGQMRQHIPFLEEHIDPDFGLLDKVRANGLIGYKEVEDVESKSSSCKRNAALMNYVFAEDQCDGLIAALRDADQIHVANYLIADGEYSDEFGEEWPLTAKEISILDTNQGSLVDLLEPTNLLRLLCDSKVINKRQMDTISSKPTLHEKNETLFKILRRRSLRDYRQTIACLHQSEQSSIAEILDNGGAVVRAHVNLDGVNVNKTESELVTKITNLLIDSSIDQRNRILELVNNKVIAVKPGQSIVLYIYCKTIEYLQELEESLTSRQLKDSVEVWFNDLLHRSDRIIVTTITVSDDEFQRMRKNFKELEFDHRCLKRKHSADTEVTATLPQKQPMVTTTETHHHASETTLNQLPFELLDIILEKSVLYWFLNSSTHQKDEDVIKTLASVNFCWFQRITRRRFKRRIWKRLKDFYENSKKRRAIVANNSNYILENIQWNHELNAALLSVNSITQDHSLLIQRQRLRQQQRLKQRQRGIRDKNAELLYVMRSCDDTTFSKFVDGLRQTNQKTMAKIMANGGVVIKVEVRYRVAKYTTSVETQSLFYDKIDEFRRKTKLWSRKTGKLISLLNENGIEILNSQLDRQTTIVWIWCRSQIALQKIQELYELNELKYVFFDFINLQPPADKCIESMVVDIDSNQFTRTAVGSPLSINFIETIYEENVRGVIKLRNEIYIICRSKVIRVYEDRIPFRFQKEIEVQESSYLIDIVSSEKEMCLYISDSWGKCVWKIAREFDGQHKVINWMTTEYEPWTLSVSSDGQLLVVSASSSLLMIYGSDAALCRSIQLPTDIRDPFHAVETSIGSFIILHQWVEKEEDTETTLCGRTIWVVSELCRDGQTVTRRFIPRDGTQQLNDPKYLSLDSDDQVFVADQRNSRVILLDSDLTWNQIICPTKEEQETIIGRPYRLCYDKEKKQLLVGGYLGKGINVYRLSQK